MSKMMVKKWILNGTEDKKKLATRLITAATVLLLIFAGSPFANTNTNTVSAQTNPYASVGTIVVNTNNTAANFTITGPANYSGNGTSWSHADAPIGTYTITYDPIPGYNTPPGDTQTLVNGGTITFTGLYNLSVGTITVTTNNSAATFTVTGPTTYTGSGITWSQANVPIGTYTITYGSIPGYDTPASDTQTLVSGSTITFTGLYNLSVGTITVTTNNSAATFNVTGPANYTGSGTSWSQTNAPIGTYTITFDSIPGYDTPASNTQTLVSKGTIAFTGTYNLSVGTITVTTNNSAATFTITGPATYTGNGTTWSQTNALIGTYTITYNPIPGYDTPPGNTQTLVSGGTVTFTGLYNDTIPPTTTATLSGTPGNNGWNISDVTVILSAVDINGGSGVKKTEYSFNGSNWNTYTAPFIITTEGTTTVYYRSTDNAGNVESARNLTVMIDKTLPVIIGSRTPAPNANGWNNGNVTVHFDCSDSISGLESCTPNSTISNEGANQLVTGTATDKAGNFASTVVGINIDKTPPTITINTPTPLGLYKAGTALNFSATDSLSGVGTILGNLTNIITGHSQEVSDGFIPSSGIYSLVVNSTDRAGNVATSNLIYFGVTS